MKSARSIIGLPVLVLSRVAGHATGLNIDLANRRLKGVYLTSMPFGARLIDFADIEIIGEVSIIARNAGTRSGTHEVRDIKALAANGERIGRVTGALIDESSGRIEAVEVSRGFWEDIIYGRRWVFDYAAGSDPQGVFINPEGGIVNE